MAAPRTIFMFSGQGSQYFQMGRELFEKNNTFRDSMLSLDEVVCRSSGRSVLEVLYSGARSKSDLFDRTLLTHPAIFMVEYSVARTLMQSGVQPDMVLGVSLGSFAGASIAGFIGVEEALAAVMGQACAFEEHCEPGGMLAVMADVTLMAADLLHAGSELAAVNFSSHFVLSARSAQLAEIEIRLRQSKVIYQRLPVAFPFHSQWIEKAQAPFASFMRSIRGTSGRIPLVCCDQMAPISSLPGDFFWHVVRRPIRFRETIASLEQQGPSRYIDVGPAGTLATFLKYGMPATSKSTVHAILTPFGFDQKNLLAAVTSLKQ
jgi:bacillaene synthase trans-acting acyltransferase